MKLILKTFCCCVVALILLGIALPSIISLQPVHTKVLQLVNLKIPGKVHLDTLQAGWFSGLEIANLVVLDPNGTKVLSAPKITLKEPLYRFLLSQRSLGSIHIDKPSVLLIEDAKGDISLKSAFYTSKDTPKLDQLHKKVIHSDTPKSAPAPSEKKSVVNRRATPPPAVQLAISDGNIQLTQPDNSYTISDLKLSLTMDGYEKLSVQLDSSLEHNGKSGSTSISLRANNFNELNQLYTQKLLLHKPDVSTALNKKSPELTLDALVIDLPVSIVDRFLHIANPKSKIQLTELLGQTLNTKISHFASEKKVDATIDINSPYLSAKTLLELDETHLNLPQGASIEWIITPVAIQQALIASKNPDFLTSAAPATLQVTILPTSAALPLSSVKDTLPLNITLGLKEPLRLITKSSKNFLVNCSVTSTAASIQKEINSDLKLSVDANDQRLAATGAFTLRNIFESKSDEEQNMPPQLSWKFDIIGDPLNVFQEITLPIHKQFTKETKFAFSGEVADINNPFQSQKGNAKIIGQNLTAQVAYTINDSELRIKPFESVCRIHPDLFHSIVNKDANSQRLLTMPVEINMHADHFIYPLSQPFSAANFLATISIKPFTISDQTIGSISFNESIFSTSKDAQKPVETIFSTSLGLKGAKGDISHLLGDTLQINAKGFLHADTPLLSFTDAHIDLKSPRLQYTSGITDITLRPEIVLTMRQRARAEITLPHNSPILSKNVHIALAKDPHIILNAILENPFVLKEGWHSLSIIGDLVIDRVVPQTIAHKTPVEFGVTSSFNINGQRNSITSDVVLTQNGKKTGSATILLPLNMQPGNSISTTGKVEKLQLSPLFAIAKLEGYSALLGSTLDVDWNIAVKNGNEFDLNIIGKTETLGLNTNITIGQEITPKPHKMPLIASFTITKERYKDVVRLFAKKDPKFILDEDFNATISFSKIAFPIQLLKTRDPKEPLSKILDELTISAKIETTKALFSGVENKTIALSPIKGSLSLDKNSRLLQFQLASEKSVQMSADWNPVISVTGSFANIWNETGFGIENAKVQLDAQVKDLPVEALETFTNDLENKDKLIAILGKEANAQLICTINQLKSGDVILNIDSTNFKAYGNAVVTNGILTLKEPLTASLIISSKAGRALLKDINPLLIGAAKAKSPIKITVANNGVSIPIKNFSFQKITIPKAKIELGQLKVKNGDTLGFIVGLLKLKKLSGEKDMNLWFTPIYLSMSSGIITCSRADALLADSFPIATWGTIDLNRDYVDMVVALHGTALEKALGIARLDPDYMLQMPLKGPTSKPVLETKRVTARIAALGMQAIPTPNTLILGGLLEVAASVGEKESAPPAPTTYPFPWMK